MAAVASDHQLIPCEPVWLATMTGRVFASVLVSSAAKKYSFQHRTSERMNAAPIPGTESGNTMRVKCAPGRKAVHESSFVEFDRNRVELVAHDPDDNWKNRQRVEQDQATTGGKIN